MLPKLLLYEHNTTDGHYLGQNAELSDAGNKVNGITLELFMESILF